jgi:AraC-like DNA-binding protein
VNQPNDRPDEPTVRRSEFASEQPGRAGALLTRAYPGSRISVGPVEGRFRISHHRVDTGSLVSDTVTDIGDVHYTATAPDRLLVARTRTAGLERTGDGVTDSFDAGDVFLVARPGRTYRYHSRGTELHVLGVDHRLVADLAGTAPTRLRLTGHRPLTEAARRLWHDTADYLARGLLADPEVPAGPLVLGSAARVLAAAVLTVFGFDAPDRAGDRSDAHPETLRRAIAYIEANAHRDISVGDIAAGAYVTPRAVQLAFRRHLGTTPMAHLRRVRLDRAHQDLRSADPHRDSVTSISSRWGFHSSSRFATVYQSTYGRLPKHTLHEV